MADQSDALHLVPRYLRVVVYFAKNPEEELTSADAVTKFSTPGQPVLQGSVEASLRTLVRDGLLTYEPLIPGTQRPKAYRAGPTLLCMIGLGAVTEATVADVMQACAALHVEHSAGTLTAGA